MCDINPVQDKKLIDKKPESSHQNAPATDIPNFNTGKEYEFLNTIIEVTHGGALLITDVQGMIHLVNQRACEMFGYGKEVFIGKDVHAFFDPDFDALAKAVFGQKDASNAFASKDLMARTVYGELPARITTAWLKLRDNSWLVLAVDDLRVAHHTHLKLQQLSQVAEQTDDLVILTDSLGTIEYVNPSFERFTGFSRLEAIGKKPSLLKSDLHPHSYYQQLWETIVAGNPYRGLIINKKKNGDLFHSQKTISPIKDNRGRITHFVSTDKTVTPVELAYRELEHYARELRQANAELEQFTYIASHDLQEPLRTISNYLELLMRKEKTKLDHDSQTFIDYSVTSAKKLQTMVQNLLAYSKCGARAKLCDVDCDSVLTEVLENLKATIQDVKAEIKVMHLPKVRGIHYELIQVFQNLISNAMKYRNGTPHISVGAEPFDRFWKFAVRDNGIGIAESEHEKIFQVFYRVAGRDPSSSGIGLAICKKIVEAQGGKIWVESKPNEGTVFFFTLLAV